MKHTLKEIVKGQIAKLSYVSNGVCYYLIDVEGTLYQLELDSTDETEFKNVSLLPQFKAIELMRWIRKGMNNGKFIQLSPD